MKFRAESIHMTALREDLLGRVFLKGLKVKEEHQHMHWCDR